jgi:hypothetical protein
MGWNQAGGGGGGGGGGGTPRDAGMCGVTGVCAKGWYNEGSPRNGAGVQDSGSSCGTLSTGTVGAGAGTYACRGSLTGAGGALEREGVRVVCGVAGFGRMASKRSVKRLTLLTGVVVAVSVVNGSNGDGFGTKEASSLVSGSVSGQGQSVTLALGDGVHIIVWLLSGVGYGDFML